MAMELRGVLKLVYPVEQGIIEDFTAMEKIFHSQFYTNLKVDPAERDVAIVVPPLVPRQMIEKLFEIMFETFNVQSLCIVPEAIAVSLYHGYLDSIVLHAGMRYTYLGIIYHGDLISHSIVKLQHGFNDAVTYFIRLLHQKNIQLYDKEEARNMLLETGRVSTNFSTEPVTPVKYTLVDGEIITFNEEPRAAFEVLFDPAIKDSEEPGISTALTRLVAEKRDLVLPGMPVIPYGTCATIPGFVERVKANTGLDVLPISDTKNPEWAGASLLIKKRYIRPIPRAVYKQFGPGQELWKYITLND